MCHVLAHLEEFGHLLIFACLLLAVHTGGVGAIDSRAPMKGAPDLPSCELGPFTTNLRHILTGSKILGSVWL